MMTFVNLFRPNLNKNHVNVDIRRCAVHSTQNDTIG